MHRHRHLTVFTDLVAPTVIVALAAAPSDRPGRRKILLVLLNLLPPRSTPYGGGCLGWQQRRYEQPGDDRLASVRIPHPRRPIVGLVIDCRPVSRVDERSAVSFAVSRQVCDAVGWAYRLVGELQPVRAGNLRWLAGYRHPRFGVNEAMAAAVTAAFAVPGPLLVQAGEVGDPIAVLPVVFHLLWRGVLTADLGLPLGDVSVVANRPDRRQPGQDHRHRPGLIRTSS